MVRIDSIIKHEAPKHNVPNKAEIDSIKKVKQKQKQKFWSIHMWVVKKVEKLKAL